MPFDRQSLGFAAFAAVALASGSAYAAPDPTGVWMNDTGRGAVEIKACGEGLCGHVVWVKDTTDSNGCGRQILGNVMPTGDGIWDNGWVYSPERKKKYDVELKPLEDGTLRVKGYAGTKLFSKTMIWTRAPADIVRCSEQQATAAPAAAPATAGAPASTAVAKAADTTTKIAAAAPDKPAAEVNSAPQAGTAAPKAAPAEAEVASDEPATDGGSDLSEALGQFLKKGADGTCKLDLPWVKLDFKCDKQAKQ